MTAPVSREAFEALLDEYSLVMYQEYAQSQHAPDEGRIAEAHAAVLAAYDARCESKREEVVMASGTWDETGGFVTDAHYIPIVDCFKIVDGTKALDGQRVQVIVRPVAPKKG